MSDAAARNRAARELLSVDDWVEIDSPGSKRHGKQGRIYKFRTEQTMLLADVWIFEEKKLWEAQPRWLKKIGGQS